MRRLFLGAGALVAVGVGCMTGFDVDQPENSFDGVPSGTDAGSFDANAAGPCSPRGVFLGVKRLGASTAGVFDGPPSLTRDELTMAWERSTALMVATGGNFSGGSPLGLPPGSSPALSPDGGLLVFSQTVDGGLDLFAGNPPFPLTALDTPGTERGAAFSADGTKLFFSSSREGPFAIDEDADSLFVATLGADGGFDAPVALTDDTTNSKLAVGYDPVPSADGKQLYFARRQADGTDHIFVADFDGKALTNLSPMAAIDTGVFGDATTNQFPGMISDDQCRLYFASDVTGDSDLYVASRR